MGHLSVLGIVYNRESTEEGTGGGSEFSSKEEDPKVTRESRAETQTKPLV